MAMSFMATHLYLTQKVETFFIGGKTLLPNKEICLSAMHAERMTCRTSSYGISAGHPYGLKPSVSTMLIADPHY